MADRVNPFRHSGETRLRTHTILDGFLYEITYYAINGNRPISEKKFERFRYRCRITVEQTTRANLRTHVFDKRSHVNYLSGYHNGHHLVYACVDKYSACYVLCFVDKQPKVVVRSKRKWIKNRTFIIIFHWTVDKTIRCWYTRFSIGFKQSHRPVKSPCKGSCRFQCCRTICKPFRVFLLVSFRFFFFLFANCQRTNYFKGSSRSFSNKFRFYKILNCSKTSAHVFLILSL